jgi:hypothetical protein
VIFIILSFFELKYPVPITVTAQELYSLLQIVFALVDPMSLARGWIIKIIVLIALVKALQAGFASEKEAREAGLEPVD